jgi:hypothetical protein
VAASGGRGGDGAPSIQCHRLSPLGRHRLMIPNRGGSPASGARGRWPWPASAPDQSPAGHHPPGLPSVDRRPVRPRLGWRSPPADRYPRNHPKRRGPGSRSRRLRRSTARRCNRGPEGVLQALAQRHCAAAPCGAVARRSSHWRSFGSPMGVATARHLPWRSSEGVMRALSDGGR